MSYILSLNRLSPATSIRLVKGLPTMRWTTYFDDNIGRSLEPWANILSAILGRWKLMFLNWSFVEWNGLRTGQTNNAAEIACPRQYLRGKTPELVATWHGMTQKCVLYGWILWTIGYIPRVDTFLNQLHRGCFWEVKVHSSTMALEIVKMIWLSCNACQILP